MGETPGLGKGNWNQQLLTKGSISGITEEAPRIAYVAWRFLRNLRAIRKSESRDKEGQSREEPGRETTEKPPARMAGIFY